MDAVSFPRIRGTGWEYVVETLQDRITGHAPLFTPLGQCSIGRWPTSLFLGSRRKPDNLKETQADTRRAC